MSLFQSLDWRQADGAFQGAALNLVDTLAPPFDPHWPDHLWRCSSFERGSSLGRCTSLRWILRELTALRIQILRCNHQSYLIFGLDGADICVELAVDALIPRRIRMLMTLDLRLALMYWLLKWLRNIIRYFFAVVDRRIDPILIPAGLLVTAFAAFSDNFLWDLWILLSGEHLVLSDNIGRFSVLLS